MDSTNSKETETNSSQCMDGQGNHSIHSACDTVVNGSTERSSEGQQNAPDPSTLNKSQKKKIIDDALKRRQYRRRRSSRKLTIAEVKADTAKILEEFLQTQLQLQLIPTSSSEYQRLVEVSIRETTTPSGESSVNLASSSSLLREDSIPFADEDEGEYELRKAESLPHDEFANFHGVSPSQSLPIHHSKSKSAPFQGGEEAVYIPKRSVYRSNKETPPAPPGTPYSPSDSGSNGSSSKYIPVPYTGSLAVESEAQGSMGTESAGDLNSQKEHQSQLKKPSPPKAPDTLSFHTSESSKSQSQTPVSEAGKNDVGARPKTLTDGQRLTDSSGRSLKKKYSGSISSSDTDGVSYYQTEGRKKKSMFKKAQERLQHMFSTGMKKTKSGIDNSSEIPSTGSEDRKFKPKKKPRRHSKGKGDECDVADSLTHELPTVLEDRYVHTNKHIHQIHSPRDKNTVIRSEEAVETVDIVNDKEKKHVEKHMKVKESSGHGGLMGKFRRLTARDKGKKIKGSQSTQWGADQEDGIHGSVYTRGVSVPGRSHEYDLVGEDQTDNPYFRMYGNNRGFEYSDLHTDRIGPNTREISATQVVCREEEKDMHMRRNSSYLDIVDHSGKMIDRLYFDEEGHELPRNKSFDFKRETYIHEQVVKNHGRVKVVRDQSHHDHMEMTEGEDGKKFEDMSEGEKEELYGKIAFRLAAIGDNLMTEKELQHSRGSSASPRFKVPEAKVVTPEPEVASSTLNALEKEISDVLKEVARDVDDRLAEDARRAALQITGLMTYHHFKNVIQDSVGRGDGWDQVAAVFHITKRAIQMAGASGALAMQIKEMSLKYIEDRFAGWIVNQGGWDSMLSESESESELD